MSPTVTKSITSKATVLAVDDQIANLDLLEFVLLDAGYEVRTATNGPDALAIVAESPPSIILLDIMMPGMDGFEVCSRLKSSRRTHFIPVVMITALSDVESKVRGLEAGADDFLNKPIRRFEVLARIRSLLRIRALRDALDSTESVIFSMVRALEGRLPRSSDHSLRVATLAVKAGERLDLSREQRLDLAWGALLHDLGKIGVPEKALLAERSEETGERLHPEIGAQILRPMNDLQGARKILRHHHERLDGSGFPDGLAGEAFTPILEIVAIAEAYEELCQGDDEKLRGEKLRAMASAGRFRPASVELVLEAAATLGEELPEPIDLVPVAAPDRKARIYVADDRASNREILENWLGDEGYDVVPFVDGEELLKAVERFSPDLLLVDVRMPGIGGEEVCRRLKEDPRYTYLPVILMTAYGESHRQKALANGADEFLHLPLNRQELVARVRSLLRLHAFHLDLKEHETVVLSFSEVLEAKDPYTRGHSARVGELAELLARELGIDEEQVLKMPTAGHLHDIGKVAVPQRILHKQGPLSDEEFEVVKTHPAVGWEILKGLRSATPVLDCVRHHHERWDGLGYPDGLAGEDIPRLARVLGMVDAWDALTSKRPYRDVMPREKAFAILREEVDEGKWDPAIFAALEALYRRGEI